MLYIKKGTAPTSFIQYKKSSGAKFDDMPGETKKALRTSLLKEQGYLCAYCMKPLEDSFEDVKIDHYMPRNGSNELEYKNLLAVCHGAEGSKPEFQTCDTKKGSYDKHKIDPQDKNQMERITYKGNGMICISDEKLQHDLDCTLNLNVDYLKAARKAALEALQEHIYTDLKNKPHPPLSYFQKMLQFYQEGENGHLRGYCGILIWYLQKKVNKKI